MERGFQRGTAVSKVTTHGVLPKLTLLKKWNSLYGDRPTGMCTFCRTG
jgi:hypothetical protein